MKHYNAHNRATYVVRTSWMAPFRSTAPRLSPCSPLAGTYTRSPFADPQYPPWSRSSSGRTRTSSSRAHSTWSRTSRFCRCGGTDRAGPNAAARWSGTGPLWRGSAELHSGLFIITMTTSVSSSPWWRVYVMGSWLCAWQMVIELRGFYIKKKEKNKKTK